MVVLRYSSTLLLATGSSVHSLDASFDLSGGCAGLKVVAKETVENSCGCTIGGVQNSLQTPHFAVVNALLNTSAKK